MTGRLAACPNCTGSVQATDLFCENCGAALTEVCRAALPRRGGTDTEPCRECGNATYVDDYCAVCGSRRPKPDREEAELVGAALITDRGHVHARNEDAAALAILMGADGSAPHAIAVAVCDGVSSSAEPQLASGAAAAAGVEAMVSALVMSRSLRAVALAGLAAAADAAAAAAAANADSVTAPSCTYTAAAIIPNPDGTAEISLGNIGDSRTYWLPDPPASARQLTVDDSLAQELITAGLAADSDMVLRGAHTLTRWLGADGESAPWPDSSVTELRVTGPGSVLMCSDGLWNYLPDGADLAQFCTGSTPADAARALAEHALQAGGEDNITVAVIPIGVVS